MSQASFLGNSLFWGSGLGMRLLLVVMQLGAQLIHELMKAGQLEG